MMICSTCKELNPIENFYKNKKQCKKCRFKKKKEWHESNKEKINKYYKEYRELNREKAVEYQKQWYKFNKENAIKRRKEYNNVRLKTDYIFKFKHNVRVLIRNSFKRGNNQLRKDAKTEVILGCTIEEFISYIETQFKQGMSFDNHGEWHLDHVIPLAIAKTEEEVIKLNHYTNFQPLWAKENLFKSDKIL